MNVPKKSIHFPVVACAYSKQAFYRDEVLMQAKWRYDDVERQVQSYVKQVPQQHIANAVQHVLRMSRDFLKKRYQLHSLPSAS